MRRENVRNDLEAFNFFDAAHPSIENLENWGHLQPECIEDITDPQTIRNLQIASICEVLNDDALNGMVAVGAESLIGTGCQMRVQCGFKNRKHNELEQYIEYLWDEWTADVCYARKLRTAMKDVMQFGSYYRLINAVQLLVSKGAEVNAKDKDGRTPLHWAARFYNIGVAQFLVDEGADVNAKTADGTTPLHIAAYNGTGNGHAMMAQSLVSKGADVNAKNNAGKTPLDVAKEREGSYQGMIDYLESIK